MGGTEEKGQETFLECESSRVFALLMMSSGLLGAFTYLLPRPATSCCSAWPWDRPSWGGQPTC